jgi:hypothetical protein
MIKNKSEFTEPNTGINFDVIFSIDGKKRVTIKPNKTTFDTKDGFYFVKSSPEIINKVAEALLSISKFVEEL